MKTILKLLVIAALSVIAFSCKKESYINVGSTAPYYCLECTLFIPTTNPNYNECLKYYDDQGKYNVLLDSMDFWSGDTDTKWFLPVNGCNKGCKITEFTDKQEALDYFNSL